MSILKKISPFVKRAEELDQDTQNSEAPLMAYYFRYFAANTGLRLAKDDNYGPAPPELNAFILNLLGRLETDKAALPEHTPQEACKIIFDFSNRLFYQADQTENIDKGTARSFYATSLFYEILDQFEADENGLSPEETLTIEYKRKFCKKRATEILNDVKLGKKPEHVSYEDFASQGTGNANVLDGTDGEDENKTTPTEETSGISSLPSISNTYEEKKTSDLPELPSTMPSADQIVSNDSIIPTDIPQVPTNNLPYQNMPEISKDNNLHIPQAPITPTIPKAPFTAGGNDISNNQPPSYGTINSVAPSTTPDLNGSSSSTSQTQVNPSSSNYFPSVQEPTQQITPSLSNNPVNIKATHTASISSGSKINANSQAQIIDDCYFAVAAAKHGDAHKTEEFLLKALARLQSGM